MDSAIIGALMGIGFLTIVNVIVVAYTYGKLSQKVADFCKRVDRMESKLNGTVGR